MIKRNAHHEQAAAFGPCAGPFGDPDGQRSWFCQGTGTERLDPARPFTLETVILCYPCFSMREGKVVERNTLMMMEDVA